MFVRITKKKTKADVQRSLAKAALPGVKKLVSQFGLAAVNNAVRTLYAERTAEKELRAAEQKVAELKKKIRR